MKHIAIVSATRFEVEPTLNFLGAHKTECIINTHITGVGMVKTAFALGQMGMLMPDLVIHAGIAGSFGKFNIGDVVTVQEDCFCELGAEDGPDFLSVDDLGFGSQHELLANPFKNHITDALPLARGITVNTTHGHDDSIRQLVQRYNPDIETMESAAFMYACNENDWQGLELRAISNRVERRNREAWNIPLAIKNLNDTLIALIASIS